VRPAGRGTQIYETKHLGLQRNAYKDLNEDEHVRRKILSTLPYSF
jgi:hypothetical protein